jgi:PAS domain S-box-containing protein
MRGNEPARAVFIKYLKANDAIMKEGDEKFFKIFYNNLVGMILTDKDGLITDINDHLLQLIELERKEVIGKTGIELGLLDGEFIHKMQQKLLETGMLSGIELTFSTKSKKNISALFSTERIEIDGRENWLSTIIDISKIKEAEEKISDSELRFRILTKTAPVGIFETDAAGLTTYVNETWLQYSGMQFEEALGDGWLDAVHPEDREWLKKGWYSKTQITAESISEYRIIDKKRKQRWVIGRAVPLINEKGTISGYMGTISDVTALKQALELLKNNEETLNKAQAISKVGNWEWNIQTGELSWSKELYRIFELEGHPSQTLFETYRKKFHPDDLYKLDEAIQNALNKGEGFTYEHRIICNDGSIKYILGIGEVIEDASGKVIGLKGTGQDITERKQAEEALNERTTQLRELSTHLQDIREDERTKIAREIHDELGQQLTGLKMEITWLKKKSLQDDPVIINKFDDTISLVDETVKSIRRITAELRPSIIDDLGFNAALEWLVTDFGNRMSIKIAYRNNFDDANISPAVSIGLFRILQESLTNIARHAGADTVSIKIEKVKDRVRLSVQDNGVGFDIAAKKDYLTFGLLGIKERAGKMQGDCSIVSEPGAGTAVEVSIPLM